MPPPVDLERPVDVAIEHGTGQLIAVVVIFLVLGGALAAMIVPRLPHSGALGPLLLGFAALVAAAPFYLVAQRRRWVRRFDHDGVLVAGGRRLPWSGFRSARRRMRRSRTGRNVTSHFELHFEAGTAYVFPARVGNLSEVLPLLDKLVG